DGRAAESRREGRSAARRRLTAAGQIPTDLPMAKSGGSDPSRLCHAQNPAGSGPSGLAAACSAELARRAGRRLGETTDASKWPSWRSWSHGDPASHDSTRARKEHGVTIDPVH